jgi:hypothetical protein
MLYRSPLLKQTANLVATSAAPLFRLFGWEYSTNANPTMHVPAQSELHDAVLSLIETAVKEAQQPCGYDGACGRFWVRAIELEEGMVQVRVGLDLGHFILHPLLENPAAT